MTPATVIGIDPGKAGAVAILHADTSALIAVDDMPLDPGGRADICRLVELLEPEQGRARMVFVEKPYTPGGRKAAEAQWWNYHACVGAVLLLRLPLTIVAARAWPGADLHVPKGDLTKDQHTTVKKARRLERVRELYPDHRHLFDMAKHDGRADAVLLARWGRGKL